MKENWIVSQSWLIVFTFISCATSVSEKSDSVKGHKGHQVSSILSSNMHVTKSDQVNNDTLTLMYIRAINDFIEAVHRKDNIKFDTLFINNRNTGKSDDFPNIELPSKINGVVIMVQSTKERLSSQRYHYTRTSPMINLMGWLEKEKGAFIFVTFFPEFNHKYDCYINYQINLEKNDYVIEKLTIEVLVIGANGKASHYEIYQNEKYVADRQIFQHKHE